MDPGSNPGTCYGNPEMGSLFCWRNVNEFEKYNAKVTTCNFTEQSSYQDRHNAVLQHRAETHDNYVYP